MTDYTKLRAALEAGRERILEDLASRIDDFGNFDGSSVQGEILVKIQAILQAIDAVEAERPKSDVPDSIASATWNTGKVPMKGKIR